MVIADTSLILTGTRFAMTLSKKRQNSHLFQIKLKTVDDVIRVARCKSLKTDSLPCYVLCSRSLVKSTERVIMKKHRYQFMRQPVREDPSLSMYTKPVNSSGFYQYYQCLLRVFSLYWWLLPVLLVTFTSITSGFYRYYPYYQ